MADTAEYREAFAGLVDGLATDTMPGERAGLSDVETRARIDLALQLNQYATRVRRGEIDPDAVTRVALGFAQGVDVLGLRQ